VIRPALHDAPQPDPTRLSPDNSKEVTPMAKKESEKRDIKKDSRRDR
jgi:hypothetical protein